MSHSFPTSKVQFKDEILVLGFADLNYDRTSIKVDLRNSPYYFLIQKDHLHKKSHSICPESYENESYLIERKNSDDDDTLTEVESFNSEEESFRCEENELFISPKKIEDQKPNFSGFWKRYKTEGVSKLLVFTGVPEKIAKSASNKQSIHILDHDQNYFRFIVRNGLSRVDKFYFIGDEAVIEKANTKKFEVSMFWAGTSLVLKSVSIGNSKDGPIEMIAVRRLENFGQMIVLEQIVRKPILSMEYRAFHYFSKITSKSELNLFTRRQTKR